MSVTPLKVLVFDIETAPGEAYFFQAKTQFIPYSMVKEHPFIICWSAGYVGQRKIHSDQVTLEDIEVRDDTRIIETLAELVREADVVIAHNGDGFDVPWLRGELWRRGSEPLGPVTTIDTKTRSARDFNLTHNNLDHIAKLKGFKQKDKTDISWWIDILNGDERVLNKMVRYNRKDVRILTDVYTSMLPHMTRLPRLVDSNEVVCTTCGSTNLQKRGKKRTTAFNYQQYQCNDCRRYMRYRTHDGTNVNDLRPV